MASEMTSEQYLAHHHILAYVEDAVTQLLIHKDEVPKIDIMRFFTDYFTCLRDGNHTLLREFAFISSTPYNRSCFVNLFYKCFANMGKKGDLLSVREYHSLVSILCPDFPFELVQKTARIVLIDDVPDCVISFVDFLYAFQLQFYYEDFLNAASEIYQTVLASPSARSPRDIIVPTDHTTEHTEKTKNPSNSEGVDSQQYLRALSQLHDKQSFCIPSVISLREILVSSQTFTFYGFLVALSKSETINKDIGKLPIPKEVFDGIEINRVELPLVYAASRLPTEPPSTNEVKNNEGTKLNQKKMGTKTPVKKRTVTRRRPVQSSDSSSSDEDSDDSDNN